MSSKEQLERNAKVTLVFVWSFLKFFFVHIDPEIYLDKSLGFVIVLIVQRVVHC